LSSSLEELSSSSGELDSSSSEDALSSGDVGSSSSEALASSSGGEQGSSSSEDALSSGDAGSSSSGEQSSSSESPCGDTDKIPTSNEFCFNNDVIRKKCGGETYNIDQFCSKDGLYTLCNGSQYDPDTEFCLDGNRKDLCGNARHEYTSLQFCYNGTTVRSKCGGISTGDTYEPGEQCCGSKKYNTTTQFCHGNTTIVNKCGGDNYDPTTQFCYEGNKVGNICGTRTEIFDPDEYECRNDSKIYLKGGLEDSRDDNKTYEAVLIGKQTWMAKNLNYEVGDSKCYDNNTANCPTYGRLYDWATANTICPTGWRLPNNNDLYELLSYVDGNTDNECQFNYDLAVASCATVSKYLKSMNGWDNNNGLDIYGFSALPDEPNKNTTDYSYGSTWWTSDDKFGLDNSNDTYANKYSMYYEYNRFQMSFSHKNNWYGVRCVKNTD
jgi:uncharacterized protein (TIGR02145 family)